MSEENHLLLKWGSLKGWNLEGNDEAFAILQKYIDLGVSVSAIMQRDTPEQKQLLCELVRVHHGIIENDWDGTKYTKEQAIDYIMNYGHKSQSALSDGEAKHDDSAQDPH